MMSPFGMQFATFMKQSYDIAVKRGKITACSQKEKQRGLNYDLCKEVAEFLQAKGMSKHLEDATEFEEELADIIIMCMTIGYENEIRLWDIVEQKINYNRQRND